MLRLRKEIKDKYKYLYEDEVVTLPDESRQFQNGRLWKMHGLNVLYLKGDRFEMAYQHGKLMRMEIEDGALKQANKISANAIANNLGNRILETLVTFYTEKFIIKKMVQYAISHSRNDPRLHLSEAWGLSEATGIPVKTIVGAALNPEASQVLLGQIDHDTSVGPFASGCTDIAAWGQATRGGEMIIGRNTDYPLNGFYDRHPVVIYFNPTDSDKKFMTVHSAGFHNAGVYGLNESGIYIGIHTVPSVGVSPNGTPAFMIGQEVLRRAGRFDDAVQAFKSVKPAAGWSYHVVSAKERKAASVEMTNSRTEVLPASGDYHVTANHWQNPEMQKLYLHINTSVDEDTAARLKRSEEMISDAAHQGGLDVAGAMAILADKFDPINHVTRSFPNVVATTYTVSSSIFLPDRHKVLVANGMAPVSQNQYVELPDITAMDPETFGGQKFTVHQNDDYKKRYPAAARAEAYFIEAKKVFEYNNDAVSALVLLRQAVEEDGSNPSLHLMHGLMAIKAVELDEAISALDMVFAANFDQQRQIVALYARGRIYAHKKMVRKAADDFDAVINHPATDKKLRKATRKYLKKVKAGKKVRLKSNDIAIMMMPGDAFRYMPMI